MKGRRDRRWTGRFEGLIEHIKGFVLAAFVLVAVLGALVGYRYHRYTQEDPEFCASCHLMSDAFREWQKGRHRDVVCQKCHKLSIFEKNQLLVAFVVKGKEPLAPTHGREKPWKACRECHMDNIAQGSLTMKKSYGHARHVFMQGMECKSCHKGTLHHFRPNEDSCRACHQERGVHGIGAEAFSCLKCHSFSEKAPAMVPKDVCIRCHTQVPRKGPMAALLCHQCHKPHGKINPTSASCVASCHSNETAVGQHGVHMNKGLDCMECHKPHLWVVGQERAKTLCSRCHPAKDPKLFIY
ncbi:MAG: NapC/NirT family cytochrome c [Thermodesulfovibrionales bacterium]